MECRDFFLADDRRVIAWLDAVAAREEVPIDFRVAALGRCFAISAGELGCVSVELRCDMRGLSLRRADSSSAARIASLDACAWARGRSFAAPIAGESGSVSALSEMAETTVLGLRACRGRKRQSDVLAADTDGNADLTLLKLRAFLSANSFAF